MPHRSVSTKAPEDQRLVNTLPIRTSPPAPHTRVVPETPVLASAGPTGTAFYFGNDASASASGSDTTAPISEESVVYSGTVLCSRDGRISWIDEGMRRFLGVDADGITHLAFDDYFVPTDKTNALPAWPRANHAPWYAIIAGHAHRVQVRVTPLPIPTDDDLQVCSIVALDEYVMDRLAAGRARLRSTIGSIVAGFAHEVRNPLASILTLTELAIRELKNSYVPFDGLLRIPALVERIERMIRQTLEYGRPPRPVLQTLNAQYVLRAAVRLVETRFPGIEFVFEDAAECSLYSDVQQVEQVLCNLLQNACEADATRVVIRLELEAGGTVLHIRVADNGSGLAEELVPYMFEPFFTSKAHGTGLGLAIARDLARLNGGDIELEENSRSGATFRVTLRSCPEANERAAAERAEAKE